MSVQGTFWYLLGAMSGLAAALVLIPVLRALTGSPRRRWAITAAIAVLWVAGALVFYTTTGSPRHATDPSGGIALSPGANHPAVPASGAGGAGSMEVATQQLAARLAGGKGSDADWQLLASSYEFLGKPAEAERARQHEVVMTTDAQTADSPATVVNPQTTAQGGEPRDAAGWLALAQSRRVARDFPGAAQAFSRAFALQPGTADDWADYADALASINGKSLQGQAATAIQRALALNPDHAKALWLAASLSLEQRRYPEALAQWQRLRAVLPANSPDLPIIDANIQEARQLAGTPVVAAKRDPAPTAAQINGTVDISPALRARLTSGMTLFIYAKSPDGAGAPLAVVKAKAGQWPVKFHLDDALAMMPGRNLSAFDRAKVEARLSSSGNAIAQKGDLLAPGQLVPTHGGTAVVLTISTEIG